MAVRPHYYLVLGVALLAAPARGYADAPPAWLPKYDLSVRLNTEQRTGQVTEKVTWTNRSNQVVHEIIFNAHAHYTIPEKDIGTLAKILEILRMAPSEAMSFDGPALDVQAVHHLVSATSDKPASKSELSFHYQQDNATALVVPLPNG